MKAGVSGVGAWYPSTIRGNDAWPEDFGGRGQQNADRTFNDIPTSDDARSLTEHHLAAEAADPFLGSRERRLAEDSTTAVDAEVAAARAAIEHAGLSPRQLDAIISYAMVPDRLMPSGAAGVAHRLGAKAQVLTFSMDAACATVIPQIAVAVGLVESGTCEHVLLTQSHLLLRTFPMTHPASPSVGDGATALIISKQGRWPVLTTHCITSGEHYRAVTWIRGSDDATDLPWWKSGGDFRLGSRDRAAAKQLMRDTVAYGSETVAEACAAARVDPERLTLLCSVQPRDWIPAAISHHMGLDPNRAISTFKQYAHVGACGPVTNLHAALERGTAGRGVLAMYAQGAGFTRGAALIALDG